MVLRQLFALSFLFSAFGCSAGDDAGAPRAAKETSVDIMTVRLTPRLDVGEVKAIDVALDIPAPDAPAGEPFLAMAIVRVMMPGALENPETLIIEDDLGVVPAKIEEDPEDPSAFRQDRRWILERATQGDVSVRYAIAPRVITPSTRPGPLIDTRTELWGFYGSGNTMLALPVEGWPRKVRIDWDLSHMPDGARAASSLGEGDAEATVTDQNLYSSFFMAGPLKSQPEDGAGQFVVYWMTPAAFDLKGAATWTNEAYDYFTAFFGGDETVFRVFMRTTERFQGGGGGGFNSFIFGTVKGEDRDPAEVRSLLAHEALHHFVGGYGRSGGGGGGQQWYSEGATNYYTTVLPYRAGLTSIDDFIAGFNEHAQNYYTNPRSNLSNEDVTTLFFSDSNAQVVPYNRGPLYFALTDARMRKASGGEKRVDDLVFEFIANRDDHDDAVAYWRRLVTDALGETGAADFDGMMAGAPLDLAPDLFGACFEGEIRPLRQFTLGFRPYKDDEGATRAGPVTPDSPADKAGIERYDVIVDPALLETARDRDPGESFTLNILRDGEPVTAAFSPWTEPSPGLQWLRTDVPEDECAL